MIKNLQKNTKETNSKRIILVSPGISEAIGGDGLYDGVRAAAR